VPSPVLEMEPAPLRTPEKLAVPPVTALNVAALLTVTGPLKVVVPASAMPRVPLPEAATEVVDTPVSVRSSIRQLAAPPAAPDPLYP